MNKSIATKDQLTKAKELILRTLTRTPTTRSDLSHLRMYGIPSASVDLALHLLLREGRVEELYTLPRIGQRETFVGTSEARLDSAIELRKVVGMQRLAELEHYIVRDVDDRLNRPNSGAPQPFPHP